MRNNRDSAQQSWNGPVVCSEPTVVVCCTATCWSRQRVGRAAQEPPERPPKNQDPPAARGPPPCRPAPARTCPGRRGTCATHRQNGEQAGWMAGMVSEGPWRAAVWGAARGPLQRRPPHAIQRRNGILGSAARRRAQQRTAEGSAAHSVSSGVKSSRWRSPSSAVGAPSGWRPCGSAGARPDRCHAETALAGTVPVPFSLVRLHAHRCYTIAAGPSAANPALPGPRPSPALTASSSSLAACTSASAASSCPHLAWLVRMARR